MMFIVGEKLKMSQIWDKNNKIIPVTALRCFPGTVKRIKTLTKDNYEAVVLSFKNYERELKGNLQDLKKGTKVNLEIFKPQEKVRVIGTSKGKGFQGVVKRHGFSGGGASHGHRHDLRRSGSIGSAFPQHVAKGKRMAGRMGGARITLGNVLIVKVDPENNQILIKGAVPGRRGSRVIIEKRK